MNNILITGNKGLIATELFKYIKADGFDKNKLIPNKKYDYIIHTASNCVIREIIKNPKLTMENILLTYKIMEKARQDKSKIILFSSGRVEHDENPYTAGKKFLENIAKAYNNCYKVESIIIRPETVWAKNEKNKRVINTWIENVVKGIPCIVYGDENKELSPIHVKEFGNIFMEIFNNFEYYYKQQTPIKITGQSRKVKDLIGIIGKYYGKIPIIKYKSPELTQPQKTKGGLGLIPFEEQIKYD